MSEYPPEAWRRLSRLLKSRRVNISTEYRVRTAFCKATGLNYKLVADIEGAPDTRTNFSDEYFALLEGGYQLAEGAIRRALEGASSLEPRVDQATPAEAPVAESAPSGIPATTPAPPAGNGEVAQYFQNLLDLVNQRWTEVTEELAVTRQRVDDQQREIDELRRERRGRDEGEQRKGA